MSFCKNDGWNDLLSKRSPDRLIAAMWCFLQDEAEGGDTTAKYVNSILSKDRCSSDEEAITRIYKQK